MSDHSQHSAIPLKPSAPKIRYNAQKGNIFFLGEYAEYEGCLIDSALELLWKRTEVKVIGIRIRISADELTALQQKNDSVPLAEILDALYEKLLTAFETCPNCFRKKFYEIAKRVVEDAVLEIHSPEQPLTAAE